MVEFRDKRHALASLRQGAAGVLFVTAISAGPAFGQSAPPQPAPAPAAGESSAPAEPAPPPDSALPKVDPIIPDDEFSKAIPDFPAGQDPALDAPLESIEAFESRLTGDSGTSGGSTSQASTPAKAGTNAAGTANANEVVQDAPVRDAELAKPLPPLDQFQIAPVEFARDAASAQPAEIHYSVALNGIDEADDEAFTSMRGMFNSLSALRAGKGKAANSAMVRARLAEDSQLVQTILASEGWYSPAIDTHLDLPTDGGAGPLNAVIDVKPRKRYTFGSIAVKAGPTVPPDLVAKSLALRVGEPIIADRVQGAEARASLTLSQNGYPFATLGQRSIVLDRRTGKGDYTLPVDTGPRSVFGSFATEGKTAFDAEHIAVMARFHRGDLYDSRKVDDLRKALVATGLFAAVSVEPKPTGKAVEDGDGDEGDEYAEVLVHQSAGKPRTVAGTVGYASGEGFKVQASWTHRNLFPPEGALIASGIAGTDEQGASLVFRRSNAGRRDMTFELSASVDRTSYNAYRANTGRLAAQWSYGSTPIWQKKFTYAFGAEVLASAEKDYTVASGPLGYRTYYIAAINGQAGFDLTDSLLDPTRGFRLSLLEKPEVSLQGGTSFHVRTQVDASGYYPLTDGLVLAGRVRLGSIQGATLDNIAPSRRFYAGGGGSVRGYAYQKLGPLDPAGNPVGARSLNEASAEVRYRFGDFGLAGFVDAGQAYTQTLPQFTDLRYGVGIGGRYYTNFGPVRIDVATPIDRRPGEGRINIYVSIGQAF